MHYTSDRVAVQYWRYFLSSLSWYLLIVYTVKTANVMNMKTTYEQTMCARACAQRAASECVLVVFDFLFCEFYAVRMHCDRESSVIIMIMIFCTTTPHSTKYRMYMAYAHMPLFCACAFHRLCVRFCMHTHILKLKLSVDVCTVCIAYIRCTMYVYIKAIFFEILQ